MFRFRLNKLLSLKEKMEEQKKNEFAIIMNRLELAQKKKEELEIEKRRLILELKQNVESGQNIRQVNEYNRYIDYMKKMILKAEENIKRIKIELEKKRKELNEAVKERKILESYKEKELDKYKLEEKKVEQGIINELTSYQYSKDEDGE